YSARRVDAVDAHVPDGAAAQLGFEADVARANLLAELGREIPRVAELARTRDLSRFEVRAIEVQAISDHELHAVLLRRLDHRLAILARDRHGLFDEHVHAGIRGAHGVILVAAVRRGDV